MKSPAKLLWKIYGGMPVVFTFIAYIVFTSSWASPHHSIQLRESTLRPFYVRWSTLHRCLKLVVAIEHVEEPLERGLVCMSIDPERKPLTSDLNGRAKRESNSGKTSDARNPSNGQDLFEIENKKASNSLLKRITTILFVRFGSLLFQATRYSFFTFSFSASVWYNRCRGKVSCLFVLVNQILCVELTLLHILNLSCTSNVTIGAENGRELVTN